MNIKPIRNDNELKAVFRRLESIFQAEDQTPEADERDVLVTLVEAYENKHYDLGPADPVEAIKFRMEQQGLTARDLEPFIGPSGRVSEVLNRKRRLSLRMVKSLHDGLKIPYESLLAKLP
ncbi:MAG: transcriptional regulator [Betaproteobacteria bacterium]|jgi:HTH-type transcriptional regulator / antitoxin HigA|nr:transcriptional regulator [Betaproteobacteria bacterium]